MSNDLKYIGDDIRKSLLTEGKKFSDRVRKNLRSKGVSKSGATEQSIHEIVDGESLIVWGRKDFHNLEKGISPQESKAVNFQQLKANIYKWSKYLPLSFENNKKRYSFAWNVSNKQNELGSVLFRKGGRSDIYSNEFQPLYDNLQKQIGEIIIQHKLL